MSERARRFRAKVQYALALLAGDAERYRLLPDALAFARLSSEEVQREQIRRLRALLVHAGTTVPYWRDLFADLRFVPRDVTSTADLAVLPILTKETIRREGDRLISDQYRQSDLLVRKTGGSTGEPLLFYASRADYEAQMSLHLRSMALAGVWPGDKLVKLWGYGRRRQWGNLLAPLTGRLFLDAYDLAPATLDRWLRLFRLFRPKAIYGYAGALHQLARHAASRGLRVAGMGTVFSTGEMLFPEQRAQIESGLGVRVCDLYGSHEAPRLASECLHGSLHAAPDAAVLEFLEMNNDPAPRLVLTSLQAWAMPLIRYDQGDAVRPVAGECPCGLPFPRLVMEGGKVHQVFALPGGRRKHTGFFYKPAFRIEALQAFQIQHNELDAVEYHAIARKGQAGEAARALDAVCRKLESELGDVRVTYRLVEALPRTPRGKQPIVVSHVEADRQ